MSKKVSWANQAHYFLDSLKSIYLLLLLYGNSEAEVPLSENRESIVYNSDFIFSSALHGTWLKLTDFFFSLDFSVLGNLFIVLQFGVVSMELLSLRPSPCLVLLLQKRPMTSSGQEDTFLGQTFAPKELDLPPPSPRCLQPLRLEDLILTDWSCFTCLESPLPGPVPLKYLLVFESFAAEVK